MSGRAPTAASPPPAARWGLLAEFDSVHSFLAAVEKVRDAGFVRFDAHAPFPVHGLDEGMGIRMTKLPWLVAGGGAAGAATALLMQWWMNGFDYPLVISGKPLFALPPAIPITFELTVLFASIGAFLGLLAANRLPELYQPVFRSERFQAHGCTDAFFIAVEAGDPKYDAARTRAFLEGLGARSVEELEA